MKILMVAMSASGHVNPMLGIARLLVAEGHEVAGLSGQAFRNLIESNGLTFYQLPGGAELNPQQFSEDLSHIEPGLEWTRHAAEQYFINPIPMQHKAVIDTLQNFQADIIVCDSLFMGIIPILLKEKRLPVVIFSTTSLLWHREDQAPLLSGLLPAVTDEERERYAAIGQQYDQMVNQPLLETLNTYLRSVGVRSLEIPLFDAVVQLADAYMQLTVPSFEFPGRYPPSLHFVGTLPIVPNQAPLPSWADDLDGSKKIVLVTQGTVANNDFSRLLYPTLTALADEPDLLVVGTTGGRPIDTISDFVPTNGRVASYLPFDWLLPKVNVFVTNGGYGSVNQAISFGIPLVSAGQTEDKADVGARIAWSGVGINLETSEPSPEELLRSIREVLEVPTYRSRALQLADEFGQIDTRAEILQIIDHVLHHRDNLPAARMRLRF